MAKTPVKVELYYSGAWNDITALDDVFTRDPIRITRTGRGAGAPARPLASALSLSLKNMSARYSPRSPMSPLYKLINRNTPIRASVSGYDVIADTFTRLSTSGWGTCEYGAYPWAHSGAGGTVAASDHRIDVVGTALHGLFAASAFRFSYLPAFSEANVTVSVRLKMDDAGSAVLGNDLEGGLMLRVQNINTYYHPRVEFHANQTITASLHAIGGTGAIGSVLVPGITFTGQWLVCKAQAIGNIIRMKVWADGTPEPAAWTLSVTDAQITAAGGIGIRSGRAAGNTNVAPFVLYQNMTIDKAYRFVGEVGTWPQDWTVDGKNVWSAIEAAGIVGRLTAPGIVVPSISSLRRDTLAPNASSAPYSYYPMEEGSNASGLADVVGNGTPMVASGTATGVAAPNFGSATRIPGSDALPAVEERRLDWLFPSTGGSSTQWTVTFVGYMVGSLASSVSVFTDNGYEIEFRFTNGVNDIFFYNPAKAQVATAQDINTVYSNWFDGGSHCAQLSVRQNAGNIEYTWILDSLATKTGTFAGTLGRPYRGVVSSMNAGTKATVGHVAAYSTYTPGAVGSDLATSMRGHWGERATRRMSRLAAQAGIALVQYAGSELDSQMVGVQRVAPTLDLLQDAADADGGFLFEPRTFLGLAYRGHRRLYNANPVVQLDYAAGDEVAPPLKPVEDWSTTANDVTVTRYQGSAARVVQETGPLNVKEPSTDPDGVGRYPKDQTLVLFEDNQCLGQASWLKHLGTWDEARYPVVNIDLTAMASKASLIGKALSLDIGDRLAIVHPPAWVAPDDIVQHAYGFTEVLESHRWSIAATATPAGPYDVGVLNDSTQGRLDNRDCTLNGPITSTTATAVNVISVRSAWSTTGVPYDIKVGGERMTVTAATAGLTQTLTVTRSVNGIVKTHPTGAPVRVFRPFRLARRP